MVSIINTNEEICNVLLKCSAMKRDSEQSILNTSKSMKHLQRTRNNRLQFNDNKESKPEALPPRLKKLEVSNKLEPDRRESTHSLINSQPLPDLRSPFESAHYNRTDNIPLNLEAWDVPSTHTRHYNDYYFLPRQFSSQRYFIKERKPYMVIPSLRYKVYEPTSALSYDSKEVEYRRSKYERPIEFASLSYPRRSREEFDYFYSNVSFSNQYVEEFISKTLQQNILPDILVEVIEDLKKTATKKLSNSSSQTISTVSKQSQTDDPIERNFYDGFNLNEKIDYADTEELFSTKFIEEFDYQIKMPIKREFMNSIRDDKVKHMKTFREESQSDIPDNYILEQILNEEIITPYIVELCKKLNADIITEYLQKNEAFERYEISNIANERLLSNLQLDILLNKVALNGRLIVENENFNKFIDGMVIDILLNVQNDVRNAKNRTLQNYPLKKFHLNTFINAAMDILISELSMSLDDDMKILNENEKNFKNKV